MALVNGVRQPALGQGQARIATRAAGVCGSYVHIWHGPLRILSATVSREANRWYVSLAVEVERDNPKPVNGPVVGIDLALHSFAVASDVAGSSLPGRWPRLRGGYGTAIGCSRKQRGSRKRRKSASGLIRLHRRIRCRRTDCPHKATTDLAKAKSVIVVEDLSVGDMIRNRHLARSSAEPGWSEFRRMLAYNTQWYGSLAGRWPRFYPSSKTCSARGYIKAEIPLGERVFRCEACDGDRPGPERGAQPCVACRREFPGDGKGL